VDKSKYPKDYGSETVINLDNNMNNVLRSSCENYHKKKSIKETVSFFNQSRVSTNKRDTILGKKHMDKSY
jgi:hypothetical protein